MKSLSLTARLISAATAAGITFMLLGAVLSIAEPQRSVLMAKMEHSQNTSLAQIAPAPASTLVAVNGR